MKTKFIFVTGGVYSSLGKGITASSIGCLLKDYGFKVTHQKLDPYLNVDSRNISPYQHGENFITDDGAIGDLDLGNYERFSRTNLTHFSTVTSGKIYWEVLNAERANKYAGKTIQVVPHITDAVSSKLYGIAELTNADFVIVEIGGTIGDIESNPFIEAIARFALGYGRENVLFAHCCPLISIATVHGELKTKPTQHSVKNLRGMGINPDILFLRSSVPVDNETKEKLAWSCAIPIQNIFTCEDVASVYFLPFNLNQQNLIQTILKYFKIDSNLIQSGDWNSFLAKINKAKNKIVNVGIVGQYIELHDAYLSLIESLNLAGYELGTKIKLSYIQSNNIDSKNVKESLKGLDGIVIGNSESYTHLNGEKIVIDYCINNKIPLLGIDSGFDAAIEYIIAKNNTNCLPFSQCELRVGGDDSHVISETLLHDIYQKNNIHQRHYSCHKVSQEALEAIKNNMEFEAVAYNKNEPTWIDAVALKKDQQQFGVFVNYRPEYVSKPGNVDPLIIAFINSLLK